MRRRVGVGQAFELDVSFVDETTTENVVHDGKRPRKVAVGHELDARIHGIGDFSDWMDAITRSRIVLAVLGLGAFFLLAASVLGWWRHDYSGLGRVWNVVGPVYGTIAGYFFGHHRRI